MNANTRYGLVVILGIGGLCFGGFILALLLAICFDLAPKIAIVYPGREFEAIRTLIEGTALVGIVILTVWNLLFARRDSDAQVAMVRTLERTYAILAGFSNYSRGEQDDQRLTLLRMLDEQLAGKVTMNGRR